MGLLSRWKVIACLVLAAAVVWGFSNWRYSAGYGDADRHWRKEWAQRDARDATALAQRQSETRAEEQRRQGEIDAIRKQTSQQLAGVQADADRARAASRGLHDKADKLARQLADRERACGAGTTGGSKTETSGAELLAVLFRQADKRARELAAIADQARIRGLACEAAYQGLTK
ncbi:DUF2514 family protein [Enterobacter sp. MF024]|uniref:DUF2514 family protein n=1 Tax=Enterobacter sp. MF024 TaxID=2555644 RepID=UPI001105B364|nr:DUF2514 family protein [Enterobacter sp. MF024]TLU69589.1 DUF2514 family protein [Enterobacter sp. MF024]